MTARRRMQAYAEHFVVPHVLPLADALAAASAAADAEAGSSHRLPHLALAGYSSSAVSGYGGAASGILPTSVEVAGALTPDGPLSFERSAALQAQSGGGQPPIHLHMTLSSADSVASGGGGGGAAADGPGGRGGPDSGLQAGVSSSFGGHGMNHSGAADGPGEPKRPARAMDMEPFVASSTRLPHVAAMARGGGGAGGDRATALLAGELTLSTAAEGSAYDMHGHTRSLESLREWAARTGVVLLPLTSHASYGAIASAPLYMDWDSDEHDGLPMAYSYSVHQNRDGSGHLTRAVTYDDDSEVPVLVSVPMAMDTPMARDARRVAHQLQASSLPGPQPPAYEPDSQSMFRSTSEPALAGSQSLAAATLADNGSGPQAASAPTYALYRDSNAEALHGTFASIERLAPGSLSRALSMHSLGGGSPASGTTGSTAGARHAGPAGDHNGSVSNPFAYTSAKLEAVRRKRRGMRTKLKSAIGFGLGGLGRAASAGGGGGSGEGSSARPSLA